MEEIQALEEETIDEELENEDHTLATLHVGELLVMYRALFVKHLTYEPSQMEQIFCTWCIIGGKVCILIIDGQSCANVASLTLNDKL